MSTRQKQIVGCAAACYLLLDSDDVMKKKKKKRWWMCLNSNNKLDRRVTWSDFPNGGNLFKFSPQTVSKCVDEVCNALIEILRAEIKIRILYTINRHIKRAFVYEAPGIMSASAATKMLKLILLPKDKKKRTPNIDSKIFLDCFACHLTIKYRKGLTMGMPKTRASRILEAALKTNEPNQLSRDENTVGGTNFTEVDFDSMPFDIVEEYTIRGPILMNDMTLSEHYSEINQSLAGTETTDDILCLEKASYSEEIPYESNCDVNNTYENLLTAIVDNSTATNSMTDHTSTSPLSVDKGCKLKLVDYESSSEDEQDIIGDTNPIAVTSHKSKLQISRYNSDQSFFSTDVNNGSDFDVNSDSGTDGDQLFVGTSGLRKKERLTKKMRKENKVFLAKADRLMRYRVRRDVRIIVLSALRKLKGMKFMSFTGDWETMNDNGIGFYLVLRMYQLDEECKPLQPAEDNIHSSTTCTGTTDALKFVNNSY
nr:unnamed protein product [Callosobruchus chinensis]